jgi:hypothetical protein
MASRFSSPPPRSYNYDTSPPPVKNNDIPMTPAAELYLALRSKAILNFNLDDPEVLKTSNIVHVPDFPMHLTIRHFSPVVFACKICPISAGIHYVWTTCERHGIEISVDACLDALGKSKRTPEQQQDLHRWIFERTGSPVHWEQCDIYMSLKRGCPSLLEEFRGDSDDPRLLPRPLKVPFYGSVDFDPVTNACACCPDPQILQHIWQACARRGLVVNITECMMALMKSPMSKQQVVDFMTWSCFRANFPHSSQLQLENEKDLVHAGLVKKVLADVHVLRTQPFLQSKLRKGGLVNHILAFLIEKSPKTPKPMEGHLATMENDQLGAPRVNFPFPLPSSFSPFHANWETIPLSLSSFTPSPAPWETYE